MLQESRRSDASRMFGLAHQTAAGRRAAQALRCAQGGARPFVQPRFDAALIMHPMAS